MSWHLQFEGKTIPVGSDPIELGRGELLGLKDKRCSRKQVVVSVSQDGSRLFATSYGVNPSGLQQRDQPKKQMSKEKQYELHDGDTLFLLWEEYPIGIHGGEEPANNKKRKYEEAEGAEASEDGAVAHPLKKTETPAVVSEPQKPPCKFGASCYRKNPQHLAEFSHPSAAAANAPPDRTEENLHDTLAALLQKKQEAKKSNAPAPTQGELSSKKPSPTPNPFAESSSKAPSVSKLSKQLEEEEPDGILTPPATKPVSSLSSALSSQQHLLPGSSASSSPSVPSSAPPLPQKTSNDIDFNELRHVTPPVFLKDPVYMRSLVFPSLATSTHSSYREQSVKVACEVIAEFLAARPGDVNLRLILSERDEEILSFYKKYFPVSDARFITVKDNLVTMMTIGRPCRFLANECNWRLKSGGAGVNRIIYEAAGEALDKETKRRYPKPALPGNVYPVPLDPSSPLYKREGVCWVLHCMPPTLIPGKPDFQADPEKAGKILRFTYKNMLDTFEKLL